ncbi:putative transport protein [Actinobacillus ureae]|uniref:Transporter, major facilitator family protein n=1 Tax=Actinobacillus ureae ATCC 25976 TaxID=887324 RepID=E8KF62_9PAST|nr:MFS transporter [Actinobacillus ureae]EFX92489.1 transporter, major facilitator family protein [Actinobacillus ureae ATCC 25976]SUT85462.1 putative transport protein [Actinobacillus ureae]SUU42692.1 putative transport protein [Actinobacillus ureae]
MTIHTQQHTNNLRHAIDNSPMSAYQWAIVIMAAVMNFLDGFDVLAIAFTATNISKEFGLSKTEFGVLVSAGLAGMTIGSLFLAPLADKFGRRPLLLLSVALSAIGLLISGLASTPFVLGFSRVITGLGVGGILVGTNVITSEYSSKKWRSFAISVYAAGFGIGAMIGGMMAKELQAAYSWHTVYFAGVAMTAVVWAVLFIWLPESIDFLTTKQPANTKARLNQIAAKIGFGFNGEWDLPAKVEAVKAKLPISQLFSDKYRRSTLLLWLSFFAIMFSFYFISSWTPALLKEAGMTVEDSINVGMAISIGGTGGSLIYGLISSRWQARAVLMLFTVLSAIAIVVFILSSSALGVAMAMGVVVGALVNGCISGLYTINPATYDANIRNTGVGWAIGAGRAGSILAPTVAGMLLDGGLAKQDLYIAVAGVMLLSTLALAFKKSNV